MKALIILGAVLLIVGLITYLIPAIAMGDAKVVRPADHGARSQSTSVLTVPLWASAAAMVTGVLFIIVGAAVRPRTD